MPADLRTELEAEGLELLVERIRVDIIYRDYQVPGQRPTSGHHSSIASIALTPRRLVVRGTASVRLDAGPGVVHSEVEEPGRLLLTYDASDLFPAREGSVEMRFETPQAADIHARLQAWSETRPN
jgi:hypothetical protein